MLQRNTSGGPLILPSLTPPAEVADGGTLDHPEPLAGFTPVVDGSGAAPVVTVTVDDLVDLGAVDPAQSVAVPAAVGGSVPNTGGTVSFTS